MTFSVEKEIQGTMYLISSMIRVKKLGIYDNLMLRSDEKLPEFERQFTMEIRKVNNVDMQVAFELKSNPYMKDFIVDLFDLFMPI